MKQEVYKSSTLGPIELSFTGRRLLANLRDAIVETMAQVEKDAINAITPIAGREGGAQ